MTRRTKIGITFGTVIIALPVGATIALFLGMSQLNPSPASRREISLTNHGTLIIDGQRRSRSEHGFSQRAGYRPPGSDQIEWFGDLSDGAEPQVHQAGTLVVVIDLPAAQLYVRTVEKSWKSLALIFPNDLGPFPISYYSERNGLTVKEVSRINQLGGTRERKYPTTYIQSFDPATRDLKCSYHLDNASAWPLHLRLSEDGNRLLLVAIGERSS